MVSMKKLFHLKQAKYLIFFFIKFALLNAWFRYFVFFVISYAIANKESATKLVATTVGVYLGRKSA